MVISFDTDFEQISADIREKVKRGELSQHIDDVVIPILSNL